MSKNNFTKKYSKGTIITHWLTALLILILFPMGKYMEGLELSEKMNLIKIHAILGTVILILTIFRSYYFFKHERPNDLKTGSKLNDKFAVWIHNAFYFLLFGIAISGIITLISGGYGEAIQNNSIRLVKPHNEIQSLKTHSILATIMIILLFLHVVGVLKHLIFKKENTLKRIT